MNKDFLNKKEPPTNKEILRYFFTREEIDEMMDSLEYSNKEKAPDLRALGDPDEVQTASGTEWEISRAKWVTDTGPKYLVYLKKVGNSFGDINFPNLNPDYTMNSSGDALFNNPFFNYSHKTEEIEYEDFVTMTFEELLNLAIENENFEEAARLRDWNNGLIELLKELKPKFIKAIEDADLDALDRYQKRINVYRAKL